MTQQSDTQQTTTVSGPVSEQVVRRTTVVTPAVVLDSPQKTYETKKAIFRSYQVIWYILGVVEVLLAFRVLLKLLGANEFSGFTRFIYAASQPFSSPFEGIFGFSGVEGMIFEWSTLIAMAVYAIVAYGIVALFQMVKPTNPTEVDNSVDTQ